MNHTHVHADLRQVAEQVEILSETRYLFCGELRDTRASGLAALSETGRPVQLGNGSSALLAFVESELYQRLYRRPSDGIGRSVVAGGPDFAFIQNLSDANTGTGTWEPGWTIAGREDALLGVRKDVVCWVPPSDVRVPGGEIRPGAACRVRVPKEIRHLVLGYYMAVGNGEPREDPAQGGGTVRLYWNLTADAAPAYLRLLSVLLNDLEIPFRSKVVAHPALYQNADSGVLYLAKEDFPRASEGLRRLHAALESRLEPAVPMFTKRLATGLGLAEDPADGLSFGQSRCRIAARSLWERRSTQAGSADARLEAVAFGFHQAGLDPARPYLRPDSKDIYALA